MFGVDVDMDIGVDVLIYPQPVSSGMGGDMARAHVRAAGADYVHCELVPVTVCRPYSVSFAACLPTETNRGLRWECGWVRVCMYVCMYVVAGEEKGCECGRVGNGDARAGANGNRDGNGNGHGHVI